MKCPKCNEKISSLKHRATTTMVHEFGIDDIKNGEYIRPDFDVIDIYDNFICPVCQETLFDSEGDAIEFLQKV